MKKNLITILLFFIGLQTMSQPFGNAIKLDGIDDYLVVPHHESLNPGNGSWSVAFWIKAANKNQIAPVVMKRLAAPPYTQYSYGFGKDDPHDPEPGKSFRVNHIDEAGVTERSGHITENVIDGEWHHIVVVADKAQDKIIIYVDGLQKGFNPLFYYGNWPNVVTTTDLFIGRGSSESSRVEGLLDELSFWNKAISAQQIQQMMTDTLSPAYYTSVDSGLVAYYRFDEFTNEGTGNGLKDDIKDLSFWQNHADVEGNPGLVPSYFPEGMTYVPDDNFEQVLSDLGYDNGAIDNMVPTANINTVKTLNVSEKNIADLTGIEDFTAITDLRCQINELTKLDVSKNTALKVLNADLNKLTELDVSTNTQLWSLSISNNHISGIDISKNLVLRSLYCSDNPITELDLIKNTELNTLFCRNNKLTNLDVSNNTKLSNFSAIENQLSEIDVSKNTALSILEVSSNKLDKLDVSNNTKLLELKCSNNQLATLNLANNTKLIELICFGNQITELNLNNNTSLEYLNCSDNLLTALDMTNNIVLSYANCSKNKLQTINLSDNKGFVYLDCSSNLLPQIELTNAEKLQYLNCSNNLLQDLEVSHLSTLYILYCNNNQIITLDLHQNQSLYLVDCSYNSLSDLNIKNGNNNLLTGETTPLYPLYFDPNPMFNASNNPNLFCIQVDNVDSAETYPDWMKDTNACYSENCYAKTYVPDDNFELALRDLGIDVDELNDSVMTARIAKTNRLNISNKNISDLTGIEDFTALTSFDCSSNKLVFANLEPIFNLPDFENFRNDFNYSPQAEVGIKTDTSVIETYDITLEIKNYNAGSNDIFSWKKVNGEKSLFANPTYKLNNVTFADSGQYICYITNSLASDLTLQSATIHLKVEPLPVGVHKILKEIQFRLFPNPATSQFKVQSSKLKVENATVAVFSITGKKCLSKYVPAGSSEVEIDVSSLNSGVYFCKIQFEDKCVTKKIVVKK